MIALFLSLVRDSNSYYPETDNARECLEHSSGRLAIR
jgi:hypothetical protein